MSYNSMNRSERFILKSWVWLRPIRAPIVHLHVWVLGHITKIGFILTQSITGIRKNRFLENIFSCYRLEIDLIYWENSKCHTRVSIGCWKILTNWLQWKSKMLLFPGMSYFISNLNLKFGWWTSFHKQLCLRSEYETLESKYSLAQETIEQLQKELKSIKRTQAGFLKIFLDTFLSQVCQKGTLTRILKAKLWKPI